VLVRVQSPEQNVRVGRLAGRGTGEQADHPGQHGHCLHLGSGAGWKCGHDSQAAIKDIGRTLATSLPHARALEIPRSSHNTANTAPKRLTDPPLRFFTDS
jgi:hypothetical protein